jgi:ATP-dependent Clp protease protease subunit
MTTENTKVSIEDAGMYLFSGSFDTSSCTKAIRFILEQNLKPVPVKFMTLIINSHGGDVNSCFALIDTMKGSKIPVRTVGLGQIASCGILTFMAGEVGHRVITRNTSILSHQYSWGSWGKEHELFAAVKEMDLTKDRIMTHYKKCTGMKEKEIIKYLLPPEDRWLDSDEAVKYGIADRIVQSY